MRSHVVTDGQHLASASADRTIKIWDVTGQCLQTLGTDTVPTSVSFDPTGSYLLTDVGEFAVDLPLRRQADFPELAGVTIGTGAANGPAPERQVLKWYEYGLGPNGRSVTRDGEKLAVAASGILCSL